MSCQRLCIDDMCHGNPDCTLCEGCYCYTCHQMTYEPGICDECRDKYEDFYDEG